MGENSKIKIQKSKLYTRFQLAKKYLHYYLTASNGKGHGIHSPFVFDFIKNVLRDKKQYACYHIIETGRQKLLKQSAEIEVTDFGAGSAVIKTKKRVVADIAASSLKSPKYARLLFRIVNYYQPQNILELGTSFGITTSYLAAGNASAKVYTIEGSESIAYIAMKTFEKTGYKNIQIKTGDFKDILPGILEDVKKVDLAFIDGNHLKEPTLDYFYKFLNYSTSTTIIIFDDIHWSAEMEEAWAVIQQHPAVTLSIDLFFIGIIFFNADINHKQHFTIRF
ncbi:MAG: class I SAM-dependent methyltransferase [Ferruginibacter sp.]